jgi:ankyrin repeat protein
VLYFAAKRGQGEFMRISTTFAEVDRVCDYIPFVSTVSNVVDLFQKCVCKCLSETVSKSRYWTHIKQKDLFRCFILLVPILGNIYVLVSDYLEYKKDKASCDRSIQFHQGLQRSQARMLASLARQVGGGEVIAEQMMPAPTEDQQCLWAACLGNDAQPIRDLLARGISPNFYHAGYTPLVTACQHSTEEIVRLLVEAGAEVTTADRLGNSPFAAACARGDLGMVQLLRPRIPDINVPNAKGVTPLMFAATSGQQNVVEFLIAQGANRNVAGPDSSDAVSCAIFLKDHSHLLPLLLTEHEDVDARRYQIQAGLFIPRVQNLSPLLYATLVGAENSAIYLVARSNVRHLDSTNSNALYYASKHMPLLQALLNKSNAPEFVNQQNIDGSTALHHAIELDRADAALLLLQNGANPLVPDNKGKIPLILACEKDFVNVVEYIQLHYADRITPEIQEQVALATRAAVACRGQAPQQQPERRDLLSSALGLVETGLRGMQSIAERRARDAQEVEVLGPFPRTGMELLLGKLPWPAY